MLNIFFPSFLADLINAIVCAALGIGGAFSIYRISIIQIRKDRLKYTVSLIESIVPSAKLQSKYCHDHAIQIRQSPFKNEELKLEANRNSNRLSQKVDQEGVYHAYLWKYGRNEQTYRDFKNLYGYIDYLDYLINDMISTNFRILEGMWERKRQYKITFQKLSRLIQPLAVNEEFKKEQPIFVEYSVSTLATFLETKPEEENLQVSFTKVVDPLRNYIVQHATPHPYITEIFLSIQELVEQYNGIDLQAERNAKDYDYYSKQLSEKASELEQSSLQLRQDFTTNKAT